MRTAVPQCLACFTNFTVIKPLRDAVCPVSILVIKPDVSQFDAGEDG